MVRYEQGLLQREHWKGVQKNEVFRCHLDAGSAEEDTLSCSIGGSATVSTSRTPKSRSSSSSSSAGGSGEGIARRGAARGAGRGADVDERIEEPEVRLEGARGRRGAALPGCRRLDAADVGRVPDRTVVRLLDAVVRTEAVDAGRVGLVPAVDFARGPSAAGRRAGFDPGFAETARRLVTEPSGRLTPPSTLAGLRRNRGCSSSSSEHSWIFGISTSSKVVRGGERGRGGIRGGIFANLAIVCTGSGMLLNHSGTYGLSTAVAPAYSTSASESSWGTETAGTSISASRIESRLASSSHAGGVFCCREARERRRVRCAEGRGAGVGASTRRGAGVLNERPGV